MLSSKKRGYHMEGLQGNFYAFILPFSILCRSPPNQVLMAVSLTYGSIPYYRYKRGTMAFLRAMMGDVAGNPGLTALKGLLPFMVLVSPRSPESGFSRPERSKEVSGGGDPGVPDKSFSPLKAKLDPQF
jgi:hypothetical protein